jgi:thiol-disulfide isomerase/thioredoxin
MPQLVHPGSGASQWFVACLCADWCDTCRDYRTAFENLARENPADAFVWIDIEDDSDWIGDIEVENFPTMLICREVTPHFFGTVLPHIEQLAKLLASVKTNSQPLPTVDTDLRQLAMKIRSEILS